MSIEDTIGYQHDVESCIVCGKNVEHGGGFAKINHHGSMVNLCCPLCQEAFQTNPAPYLARRTKALAYRELRKFTRGDAPPGGAEPKNQTA